MLLFAQKVEISVWSLDQLLDKVGNACCVRPHRNPSAQTDRNSGGLRGNKAKLHGVLQGTWVKRSQKLSQKAKSNWSKYKTSFVNSVSAQNSAVSACSSQGLPHNTQLTQSQRLYRWKLTISG